MGSLYLNKTPPNPAWNSQALSVVKSAGLNQDGGTPVLDVDPSPPSTESQQIWAVAGNDDPIQTFSNVHVQLWALAFATATAPGLYLTSMGGTKGITIPSGVSNQIDVGPLQEQPFTRDWDETYGLTSTDPEIVSHFVNGEVHCCILGNVYHPNDPGSAAIPNDPNGPGSYLDVAGNRHHAQRNMTIKTHAAGLMSFHMFAANPDPEREQVFTLQILQRDARELEGWERRELDALGPWIRRTKEAPEDGIPGLEIVFDGKRHPVRAGRELEDLELHIRGEGRGRERKIELGANDALPMQLNAGIPDEDFVLRIIDVAQAQGDRTVGGARIMLMTVPPELCRSHRDRC